MNGKISSQLDRDGLMMKAQRPYPNVGGVMSADRIDEPTLKDLNAQLERAFIEEYLRAHGWDMRVVQALPPDQLAAVIKDACLYASAKLAEVEARAHYVQDIHRRE